MSASRDITRDMRRLAALYNGVAKEQLLGMCWDILVSVRLSDNMLEIEARECTKPIQKAPMFDQGVSEEMKRTFVSINRCVLVLVYNTAWLAYCADALNAELVEMMLPRPKRVHDVEVWRVDCSRFWITNCKHVVLVLEPRSGGDTIVADATYGQYSFERGIDTLGEYLATKALKHEYSKEPFGAHFDDKAWSSTDTWGRGRQRAITRTTNNVMVRELERVGGFEAFLEMSEERFQDESEQIFAAVKTEMKELRLRLEKVTYGPPEEFSKGLKDLVRDCDGTGHQTCLQSYQRFRDIRI